MWNKLTEQIPERYSERINRTKEGIDMVYRSDLRGLTVAQLSELSWQHLGDAFTLGLIADAVEDRGFDPYA